MLQRGFTGLRVGLVLCAIILTSTMMTGCTPLLIGIVGNWLGSLAGTGSPCGCGN